MVKCPFCWFDNEDGALFCEQCKSDLSVRAHPRLCPAARRGDSHGRRVEEPIPMAARGRTVRSRRFPRLPMAGRGRHTAAASAAPRRLPGSASHRQVRPFRPGATPKAGGHSRSKDRPGVSHLS